MHFAKPEQLYWLWALIPLVGFLWWGARRKAILLTRFLAQPLIPEIREQYDEKKARWKDYALMGVVVFSVAALARPQWGFQIREVKRQGVDIILVVDTSRSMLTEDVKPNRLERTKLAIRDFLKKLKGDRVGLIAFAGDAFLVCPLTVDYEGFLLSLEDLSVESVPRGGTNIAAALKEALTEYDVTPAKHKAVVIVTDGENLEDDPMPLARKAREQGIKIFCVGIGTREGELVRVPNNLGEYEFLKDDKGNFVKSRLNENLLQDVAVTTGGVYARAGGAEFGLDLIYDRELSKMEKRDIESKTEKRYFERFQIPLAVALIFLVIESLMTTRKKTSSRTADCQTRGFGMTVLVIVFIFLGMSSPAVWAASKEGHVKKGNAFYQKEDFSSSLKHYEEALKRDPESPAINFDAGTAAYKNGDFDAAIEHLQKALLSDDPVLKKNANFNLGNALYAKGKAVEDNDADMAIDTLKQSLSQFETVLNVDDKDADAQYNHDVVKKELEKLRKKQREQRQKSKDQSDEGKRQQQKEQPSGDQPQSSDQNKPDQQDQSGEEPREQEGGNKEEGKDQQEAGSSERESETRGSAGEESKPGEMTKEEAEMLLRQYRQNEEPRGLLNFMKKKGQETPVLKNW